MPRPQYPAEKARRLLRSWLDAMVQRPAHEAPLTREVACAYLAEKKLPTSLASLHKYGLAALVGEAVQAQEANARSQKYDAEAAAYHGELEALRAEIRAVEARNKTLLAQIATMTYNARRLGVKHEELVAPMRKPDRSASRAGTRKRATS